MNHPSGIVKYIYTQSFKPIPLFNNPEKQCVGQDYQLVACDPIGWKNYNAINNQCPVCGTMAKPTNTEAMVAATSAIIMLYPVRCYKCNAAFFRDSE